jgi:hypothetical protein
MADAHHAPAGDLTREGHRPGPGRSHLFPRRAGEVDTAVARRPGARWRIERAHDEQRPSQRSRPLWSDAKSRQHKQEADQRREQRHATTVADGASLWQGPAMICGYRGPLWTTCLTVRRYQTR